MRIVIGLSARAGLQDDPITNVGLTARSRSGFALRTGTEVHDERTDELSYGDASVLAGLLQRSGSRSCT